MPRAALVALVAAVALGAAAAPAAGAPLTLGSPAAIEGTDVAVAPDGTAHVAWGDADGSGARRVRYCRLPRGASACSATAEFPANGQLFSKPTVLVADGGVRVIVVWATLAGVIETFTRTSTDAGTTFGGQIGVGDGAADEYVLGPGNAISGASAPDTSGAFDAQYWDFPLDGSGNLGNRASIANPQNTAPHAFIETWNTTLAGSTPMFAYNSWPNGGEIGAARVWAFRWSGSGTTRDAAQWQPPIAIGQGAQSDVAGSVFVYAQNTRDNGDTGPASIKARRLEGLGEESTVAAGELVEARSPEFGSVATAGASGFVATWIRTRASSRAIVSDVRYSQSSTGQSWSAPVTIACADGTATRPQVAAAPDGGGAVVYRHQPRGGGLPEVRVVPFAAQPQTAPGCSSGAGQSGQQFSGMLVLSRSVGVPRRTGRFKLLVQCSGAIPCRGKASLRGVVGRRLGTLAKGSFRVGANRRARVSVKMTRAGLRSLRARRRLPAAVTLRQTGGPSTQGAVTLKLKR